MRLFAGDDWAEDHHDVEVMDEDGGAAEVAVGIETGHGPWVTALIAAGYRVFAVNPLQASRYRERHGVSGAKSDAGDAHMLAGMVRTDSHQLREAAAACAGAARSLIALIVTLNEQVSSLEAQVREYFGRHPDAEACLSQPGLGNVPGARVLAEFGDDPDRYRDGKARRNYAATSPLTRASGKKKVVSARYVRNDRLLDALRAQAFAALKSSPSARAFYDEHRAKGIEHNDALRRLANRLAGILHGCLKTGTLYNEATPWGHRQNLPQSSAAA